MAFRVEISLQAERDAESILEWLLSEKTGQTGIDWFHLEAHFQRVVHRFHALLRRHVLIPESKIFLFRIFQPNLGHGPGLPPAEKSLFLGIHINKGRNRGERIRTSDLVVPNQISMLVDVCRKRVDP